MKKLTLLLVFLTSLSLLSSCAATSEEVATNPNDLRIGGLLDLSGSWKSLGLASQKLMNLAARDVNAYFDSVGSEMRVSVEIVDTHLDPEIALEEITSKFNDGVTVFVGPQSSSELRSVAQFANENGALVISQGSTAGSLSIAGDNLFRFCPDDRQEGAASAALIKSDNIDVIIPVYREDAGNSGLVTAVQNTFTAAGGVVLPSISYTATETNFAHTAAVLTTAIESAISQYGAGKVAVYAATFDEVTALLGRLRFDPVVSSVKWYAGDGITQSATLLADTAASAFAVSVGLPAPTFGLDASAVDIWNRIDQQAGVQPDAFALAAYDAVWVAALSQASTLNSTDIGQLKRAFVSQAERYFGATGRTTLNAAGDRSTGTFDFWSIVPNGSSYQWKMTASYSPANGGTITRH